MPGVRLLARIRSALDEPRYAWGVLGIAMAISAALILIEGRGTSFSGDELVYYARLTDRDGVVTSQDQVTLGYLLAPHNGHLQLFGKMIYEAVFAVDGPNYIDLRVIEMLGVLGCVALFFELARRRVGGALALAPCLVLLCFGAAWENLLWPFDIHTVLALAAGLGALLALERADRRGDVVACGLLVVSAFTIELGLAFVLAAAVLIVLGEDRRRRLWVFAIPVALYAVWWIWARKFGQSALDLANLADLPGSLLDSLTAVLVALTGLFPAGVQQAVHTLGTTGWGAALALALVAALAIRLWRTRPVSPWTWALLAAVLGYWALIALADRPEDSARYLFAGAILLLVLAAEAWRGARVSGAVVLAAFALAAVAIPANLVKLHDGRRFLSDSATASRTEYAMLELAGAEGDPAYTPYSDPELAAIAPAPQLGLDAATYLDAAAAQGSIAFSLGEVESQPDQIRRLADATLAHSLGIGLEPAAEPAGTGECERASSGAELPSGGALLSRGPSPTPIGLARFGDTAGVDLESVEPGSWATLAIPADESPTPWRIYSEAPVIVCPLG